RVRRLSAARRGPGWAASLASFREVTTSAMAAISRVAAGSVEDRADSLALPVVLPAEQQQNGKVPRGPNGQVNRPALRGGLPLFCALSSEAIRSLEMAADRQKFDPGEVIFNKGDTDRRAF